MALRKICAQKNHTEVWYNICVTKVNIDCCKEEPPLLCRAALSFDPTLTKLCLFFYLFFCLFLFILCLFFDYL